MMYRNRSALFIGLLVAITVACNYAPSRETNGDYATFRLPYPTEWSAQDFPPAPGDVYATRFVPGDVSANAPAISEWNRTVHPDESFTMTGIRFTLKEDELAGSDTTIWIWADTPAGGELRQALVWSVRDEILTATLPADIPFGMYLVWVENEAGISAPVALNRATPEWLGPLGNTVRAGEEKRVFGRNLATGHGTETSNVFLRPADGGELMPCKTTNAEPYSVQFIVPETLADGSYEVYVHNGHGGEFGWGGPLELVIYSQRRADREIAVAPDAEDLAQALQTAIDQLHQQPGGGTVRLSAGEYNVEEELLLKEGVALIGAGKTETIYAGSTLLVRSNTAVENMTLSEGVRSAESAPYVLRDVRFANLITLRKAWRPDWHERIEIADSHVPIIDMPGADMWFHGNLITGDRFYDHAGIYPFGSRVIIERNNFENEWPRDPDGNIVMESSPYMARETHRGQVFSEGPVLQSSWIARVVCVAGRGYKPIMDHHYIAHNTSKHVTSERNIGEMILFHCHRGRWFGRVLKNEGSTLTVTADGLIDGQRMTVRGVESGGPIVGDVGDYVAIIGGTGIGQARRIVSLTDNTITVDRPWRLEPDADSNIIVATLWMNNIVYRNELNAFIEGYKLTTGTASTGINIWGNTWNTVSEGNVSRRTGGARNIYSTTLSPSYWNEFRNEHAYDRFFYHAFYIGGDTTIAPGEGPGQVPGSITLGNVFRGGIFTLNEHPHGARNQALLRAGIRAIESRYFPHIGNTIENLDVSKSTLGISHTGMTQTLMRKNVLNLLEEPASTGANIEEGSDLMLYGNNYVNATTIYASTGFSHRPIALHRVAHFRGKSGRNIEPVVIPVANAGIRAMDWQAVPDKPWIEASIVDDGSLAPESIGQLEIRANTAKLPKGTHTGNVTIMAHGHEVAVSVRLNLE